LGNLFDGTSAMRHNITIMAGQCSFGRTLGDTALFPNNSGKLRLVLRSLRLTWFWSLQANVVMHFLSLAISIIADELQISCHAHQSAECWPACKMMWNERRNSPIPKDMATLLCRPMESKQQA